MIRRLLAEPRLVDADPDAPGLVDLHRRILASKPLTRSVFLEVYRACRAADERHLAGDGARVEIGAGSSFLGTIYRDVLTTDIKPAAGIERVVDAMAMPFATGSVRAVYGIHCFHHLPDPARFLAELVRVLAPGGGCILVEPYYGPLAAFVYRRLFTSEGFDPRQQAWRTPMGGPMSGANQALSYVVFARDRDRLRSDYPQLELVLTRPLTSWIRYLASGGLNFRTLAPGWSDTLLRGAELALAPAARWLALHHLLVLRRR